MFGLVVGSSNAASQGKLDVEAVEAVSTSFGLVMRLLSLTVAPIFFLIVNVSS